MARAFWSPRSGGAGQSLGLLNDSGQLPSRSDALIVDPASDILYPAPGGGLLRVAVGGGAASQLRGTANGQLVFWSENAGQWVNSGTPGDFQSPRWNALANAYDFTTHISPGNLTYFDNAFSPVGLWNFNGTLADSSGNGFDLTASQAIGYAPIFPGKIGVIVNNSSTLSRPAFDALLAIPGDVALACIVQLDDNPGGTQPMLSFVNAGETQATNTLYQGSIAGFSGPPRRMLWVSESGAGVDASFTSGGSSSIGLIHNLMFLGWNRANNIVQPYLNGKPFGPPSAALTPPDGGTSSRFFLGSSSGTSTISSVIFCAQVIPRGLSAAEWLAMYNRSMGPAFGILN